MRIYRLNASEMREWSNRTQREDFKSRLFALHGTVQVRAPSGQIMGTVRDATVAKRINAPAGSAVNYATPVKPGECLCREWQKPEGREKEHHPVCVHREHWENYLKNPPQPRAPALKKASGPRRQPYGESRMNQTVVEAPAPLVLKQRMARVPPPEEYDTERPPAQEAPELLSEVMKKADSATLVRPEQCACSEWQGKPEGRHHPACANKEEWERTQPVTVPMLFSASNNEAMREATAEEIERSRAALNENGTGIIRLSDDQDYYVSPMPEQELKQASA